MKKYQLNSSETRIFVRHSDGNSLVVPTSEGEVQRLSFSTQLSPELLTTPSFFDTISDETQLKQKKEISDFSMQYYLGHEINFQSSDISPAVIAAHGILGQIWPNRPVDESMNRTLIPFDEVKDIMNNSPLVDSIDRRLAFSALRIIEDTLPRTA